SFLAPWNHGLRQMRFAHGRKLHFFKDWRTPVLHLRRIFEKRQGILPVYRLEKRTGRGNCEKQNADNLATADDGQSTGRGNKIVSQREKQTYHRSSCKS